MTPVSILVVDDNEAFANLLAEGLRERGHTVTCAANGQAAATLVQAQPYDAIITDIIMPTGDGFELIDEIKRTQPTARVVAMSGGGKLYSAGACLQAAEQSGVDAVLQKPFGPQALAEQLELLFAAR